MCTLHIGGSRKWLTCYRLRPSHELACGDSRAGGSKHVDARRGHPESEGLASHRWPHEAISEGGDLEGQPHRAGSVDPVDEAALLEAHGGREVQDDPGPVADADHQQHRRHHGALPVGERRAIQAPQDAEAPAQAQAPAEVRVAGLAKDDRGGRHGHAGLAPGHVHKVAVEAQGLAHGLAVDVQPRQAEAAGAARDIVLVVAVAPALAHGDLGADPQPEAVVDVGDGVSVAGGLLRETRNVVNVAVAVGLLDHAVGEAVAILVHVAVDGDLDHIEALRVAGDLGLQPRDALLVIFQPSLGILLPGGQAAGHGRRAGAAHAVQVDLHGLERAVELTDRDRQGLVLPAELGHGGIAGVARRLAVLGHLGLERDDARLVLLHLPLDVAQAVAVPRQRRADAGLGGRRVGRGDGQVEKQAGSDERHHLAVLPGSEARFGGMFLGDARQEWLAGCTPALRRPNVRSKGGVATTSGHRNARMPIF